MQSPHVPCYLFELKTFNSRSYNSFHYALNRRLMKATSKLKISESQSNSKKCQTDFIKLSRAIQSQQVPSKIIRVKSVILISD